MALHPFAALLDTPAVSPGALVSSTPQVSPGEMETCFPALGEMELDGQSTALMVQFRNLSFQVSC